MTWRIIVAAIGGVVMAYGLGVHATIGSSVDPGVDTPLRNIPKAVLLPPVNPVPTLRIMNVRLEVPPADAPTPSAFLKFDMLNDGGWKLTDIVIQISMLETPRDEHALGSRRFVVNPFMIRGSVHTQVVVLRELPPRRTHQGRYHSPPLRACASRDRELPKAAHQPPV